MFVVHKIVDSPFESEISPAHLNILLAASQRSLSVTTAHTAIILRTAWILSFSPANASFAVESAKLTFNLLFFSYRNRFERNYSKQVSDSIKSLFEISTHNACWFSDACPKAFARVRASFLVCKNFVNIKVGCFFFCCTFSDHFLKPFQSFIIGFTLQTTNFYLEKLDLISTLKDFFYLWKSHDTW